MAEQIREMSVTVSYVRQADGTYATLISSVGGVCNDPAGTNPTARAGGGVSGIVVPAYFGGQTCDAMVAQCFSNTKAAAGVP
jgi:hypothetical protein